VRIQYLCCTSRHPCMWAPSKLRRSTLRSSPRHVRTTQKTGPGQKVSGARTTASMRARRIQLAKPDIHACGCPVNNTDAPSKASERHTDTAQKSTGPESLQRTNGRSRARIVYPSRKSRLPELWAPGESRRCAPESLPGPIHVWKKSTKPETPQRANEQYCPRTSYLSRTSRSPRL
jgi:hypothetical protein